MSNKLRPCPFCGKETAEVECDGAFWWVKCQSCGASGHVYWFILNNGNARDIVIDNWNTRPIEDALRLRIAELEESDKHWAGNVKVCMQLIERYESDIAELEAESERFTVHSDIERQDDKWIPEVQDV